MRLALWLGWLVTLTAAVFLPLPEDWRGSLWEMKAPLGALMLVCTLGKVLYDTLYYDRYRP